VLLDLNKTDEGRSSLSRTDFVSVEPANSKTFDPVRKALAEYKRFFGKLPDVEGASK
jgi:hypothetical protein